MNTSVATVTDTGRVFTKVDVITDAYSRMRISGLTVDPTPEDLEIALSRLEDMMSEWSSRNIIVNYNFEDEPDPNSVTNVKSSYKIAMSTNLALDLFDDFGMQVPMQLYRKASSSLDNISGRVALERLNQVAPPRRQPIGSGNSLRWNRWSRFYRNYSTDINVNQSYSMFVGDINDFKEQFDAYLNQDEEISSLDIQVDSGLILESSSIDGDDVLYRLKATGNSNEYGDSNSQVTIIITTDAGRVETRRIFFHITRANNELHSV